MLSESPNFQGRGGVCVLCVCGGGGGGGGGGTTFRAIPVTTLWLAWIALRLTYSLAQVAYD